MYSNMDTCEVCSKTFEHSKRFWKCDKVFCSMKCLYIWSDMLPKPTEKEFVPFRYHSYELGNPCC